ncbi:hypothetical protein D3C73_998470 [compost metagenome]
MDQRGHRIARVAVGVGRAAGQQLGGDVLAAHRHVGDDVQALPGFDVPVAGEHRFKVRHRRPAHARHQLAVGVAGNEFRPRQVLRTDIAHFVVDHRDLAMVAQVHAPAAAPAQAAGQHRAHFDVT